MPLASGRVDPEFSDRIRGVTFSQGVFVVGQEIEGEGIPAGTVVTKVEGSPVEPRGTTLTLSAGAFPGSEISITSPSAAISQRLTGLTAGMQYHFRIVASNGITALGPDGTITTFSKVAGAGGRAYEMVSPAKKIGEVFPPEPEGELGGSCSNGFCLPGLSSTLNPMQARADGEALAFEGQPFTAGLSPAGNEYIGQRSSAGWTTTPITPPTAPGRPDGSGFRGFSPDLARGVVLQTRPKLSPEAPGEGQESFSNLYLWEAGNPTLRPLVTTEPPNRDPGSLQVNSFNVSFAGGNSGAAEAPAFSHLAFAANDALTPAVPTIAPAAPETGEGTCGTPAPAGGPPASNCNLYEWFGGHLQLVNVLPGNTEAAHGAVIGSGTQLAESLASISSQESQAPNVDHAISADGRRIFWSDNSGQVYVRVEGDETVKLKDPGQFLTATPDGSKVLLSDGCIYSLETENCATSLTGSPAGFLGSLGASEDLSRIYFVSTEALATGAEARSCSIPGGKQQVEEEEGKVPPGFGCNVYAYDEGEVRFVTTLNQADNNFGFLAGFGDWKASRSNRTSQVSPDGRYLTLMSFARLTGYDNRLTGGGRCRGAINNAPCFEVYEYDMDAGSLECASCNPSGQRPLGNANLSLISISPGTQNPGGPFPQPENLPGEGEGRLFFESQDALVAKDTNGRIQDVYEWTPNGVGGCTRVNGCVALVSSGHSPNDSMFVTSTPDAKNAFFITREQLLAQDQDEQLDVYDARVGGGIAEGGVPPCSGEACRGALSPPPAPTPPGSSLFTGRGNLAFSTPPPPGESKPLTQAQKLARALKACAKKPKRKRRACRARARKRYGPSQARAHHKHKKRNKVRANGNRGGAK
jgi:hypothetical protein